jgi:titin
VITDYEYQLNGAGSWFSLGTTSSPASIGVTNGVAYTVKLRAVNVAGSGPASDASGSFTPRTTPSAPTGLSATPGTSFASVTPGSGSASIAFAPGADGGVSITKYQYRVGSGPWTDAVGTTSPISISGLTNGTNSSIKLRAVNSAGDGAASEAVSVTPRTTPAAPTSLVATAGVGSASIAFAAGGDGGSAITKYQVKVGTGSWTDVVGTSSPITVSGLTNFVSASIRLRAVNSAGNGAASVAVMVTPRLAGPEAANATPSGRTGIVVTFSLNPLPGTTVAYQSVVAYARGTNTVRGTCRTYARQTTCYIGGLTRATTYDLRVTAHLPVPGKTWHNTTFEGSILQVRTNR